MVEYRSFRNNDPPRLLQLLREANLGRGFAPAASIYHYDLAVMALPYFEPAGLIVASEDDRLVGFVHAGFGFQEHHRELDHSQGVISSIVVHPDHQRSGVATELLKRAEDYLKQKGATHIQAGQSRYCDPFYQGIYGGAHPSGFLQSDTSAAKFMSAMDYEPKSYSDIFQKDIANSKSSINFRIMSLKRQTELIETDEAFSTTFWWYCHYGNVESRQYQLVMKKTGDFVASLTVIGLDCYIASWGERAVGIVDIFVAPEHRRKGFGQTIVTEALRQLKGDMISLAECHIPEENEPARALLLSLGFVTVDRGVVFEKSDQSS